MHFAQVDNFSKPIALTTEVTEKMHILTPQKQGNQWQAVHGKHGMAGEFVSVFRVFRG